MTLDVPQYSMYTLYKLIPLVYYRQQQLQFRPPLEEVKAKYYRELKKFVCIPHHFRGVGDTTKPMATIYPRIIDHNAVGFSTVYRKV